MTERQSGMEISASGIAPPSELLERPIGELLHDNRLDGMGSATQQIYRLLHGLIVNLRLLPNQMLSINEVAEHLNISKTPIREAFIRLAEDGLVNIVPKKGTFVAPIDIQKAFEGYFIRISLESACAAFLARKGTPDAFAALREELARQESCVERGDADAFYILDNRFHAAMFDVAGLSNTRRLVDGAKAEVDRIKGLKSIYRVCRPDEVLFREHTDIYKAIENGDVQKAKELIRHHLTGMNEAIQAIAKEDRLWGMVKTINQGVKIPRQLMG